MDFEREVIEYKSRRPIRSGKAYCNFILDDSYANKTKQDLCMIYDCIHILLLNQVKQMRPKKRKRGQKKEEEKKEKLHRADTYWFWLTVLYLQCKESHPISLGPFITSHQLQVQNPTEPP